MRRARSRTARERGSTRTPDAATKAAAAERAVAVERGAPGKGPLARARGRDRSLSKGMDPIWVPICYAEVFFLDRIIFLKIRKPSPYYGFGYRKIKK